MPLRAEAGDRYAEEVELDSRFAAVDDNEEALHSSSSFSSSSSVSYAYPSSASAVTRFALPLLYLLAAFLLLLTTSGRAGAVSEAMGFGPKLLRREADLVGNVTQHLHKQTAPLMASLGENAALLAAVGGDLDALLAKTAELEADQTAVARRFAEAHRKVDSLLAHHKVRPSVARKGNSFV